MFIFIIAFVLFLIYLPPLINFSDGTEFAITFYSLGISHPPSYPLFINLSRSFNIIPLGNIYFKLCLFTAIISSLVIYTIWRFYKGTTLQKTAFSLFLLSTESFFENSIIGEVYGLNLLFFAIIFFLIENIEKKKNFYLIFFLLGLALGNHHTILLLVPYLFLKIYRNRKKYSLKDFSIAISFVLLGLSVYLYLPIRAAKEPLWNWGNPKNVWFFLTSFFRWDFENKGLLRPIEHFLSQISCLNPINEIGLTNSLIAIFAIIFLFIKERDVIIKKIFIVFCYSVIVIFLLGYDDIDVKKMCLVYSPFFIPSYFILASIVADSMKYIKKLGQIIVLLAITFGAIINLKSYIIDFGALKFSFKCYNYTKSKMSMLPRNSVLIVQGGEEDFPLFFKQKIAKFREDITIIPLSMLGKKWNFKESIKVGTTYTRGFEGEFDKKKSIVKAVVLFQRDFNNKRVFLSNLNNEEVPSTLKLDINGPFFEYGYGGSLDYTFLRESFFDSADREIVDIAYNNMKQYKNKDSKAFNYYSSLWSRLK